MWVLQAPASICRTSGSISTWRHLSSLTALWDQGTRRFLQSASLLTFWLWSVVACVFRPNPLTHLGLLVKGQSLRRVFSFETETSLPRTLGENMSILNIVRFRLPLEYLTPCKTGSVLSSFSSRLHMPDPSQYPDQVHRNPGYGATKYRTVVLRNDVKHDHRISFQLSGSPYMRCRPFPGLISTNAHHLPCLISLGTSLLGEKVTYAG